MLFQGDSCTLGPSHVTPAASGMNALTYNLADWQLALLVSLCLLCRCSSQKKKKKTL